MRQNAALCGDGLMLHKCRCLLGWKIAGKGENSGLQHCLLFPCCFLKRLFTGLLDGDLENVLLSDSTETESPVSYTSRTHTCGSLRQIDIGKHVRLCGWIQSVHFQGKFIQLRDWDGWTQLVFNDNRVC